MQPAHRTDGWPRAPHFPGGYPSATAARGAAWPSLSRARNFPPTPALRRVGRRRDGQARSRLRRRVRRVRRRGSPDPSGGKQQEAQGALGQEGSFGSGQLPPLAARCRRRAAAAPVPRSRSGCCTARPPAVAPRRVAVARPRSTHSALTPYIRAARSFFSCAGVRVGVGETVFSYVHAHACMPSRAVTAGSVTRNIRVRPKCDTFGVS